MGDHISINMDRLHFSHCLNVYYCNMLHITYTYILLIAPMYGAFCGDIQSSFIQQKNRTIFKYFTIKNKAKKN